MFDWFFDACKKIKKGLMTFGRWVRDKYRRNRRKCRGFFLILALLMLLTGLIVGSYKSVDSVSQGVPINYTSGTMEDLTISNEGFFLGLNTYYKTVPNTYFAITFDNQAQADHNTYGSIRGRVQEGIQIEMEVYARVKIQPDNLKNFLQKYGISSRNDEREGWQVYIAEKIRNVVVQQVAKHKLYAISNQIVIDAVNTQLTNYQSTYSFPYTAKVMGLNMHYPEDQLRSNNTLGVKLLEAASLLSQLQTQKSLIDEYISKYQTTASGYASQGGELAGRMASGQLGVKLSSAEWVQGIQLFNSTVQNSTLLQKYLQIYFNSLYNVTYRLQTMQPFQI